MNYQTVYELIMFLIFVGIGTIVLLIVWYGVIYLIFPVVMDIKDLISKWRVDRHK